MLRRRGFTLIEILVVILMMLILIAIAFPVFGAAKARAHQLACGSNLKRIAALCVMHYDMYSSHPSVADYGVLAELDGLEYCPDAPEDIDTYADNWNPWPADKEQLIVGTTTTVTGAFVLAPEDQPWAINDADVIRTFCEHRGTWIILWCDGHITREKSNPLEMEGWDPEAYGKPNA